MDKNLKTMLKKHLVKEKIVAEKLTVVEKQFNELNAQAKIIMENKSINNMKVAFNQHISKEKIINKKLTLLENKFSDLNNKKDNIIRNIIIEDKILSGSVWNLNNTSGSLTLISSNDKINEFIQDIIKPAISYCNDDDTLFYSLEIEPGSLLEIDCTIKDNNLVKITMYFTFDDIGLAALAIKKLDLKVNVVELNKHLNQLNHQKNVLEKVLFLMNKEG